MKTKLLAFMAAAVAACLGAFTAYAYDEPLTEVFGGIVWTYTVTNEESTVTGMRSTDGYYQVSGDVVFPSTLGGYPVVASYGSLQRNNNKITSVTFPDSFRELRYGNFSYCPSLTNVTFGVGFEKLGGECFAGTTALDKFVVPEANKNFSAEGGVLYSKDKKTLVRYAAKGATFTVPSSVTAIGASAFERNSTIQSVLLPSGLKEIRDNAFGYAENLTTVNLPSGLLVIGVEAFRGCELIESVTIPGTLTSFGEMAFMYCTGLKNLTIQNGVTEIAPSAFEYCDSLTKVVIPNSVTAIRGMAFDCCSNLSDVTIGSGVVTIGDSLTFDEGLGSVAPAFGNCASLLDFKLASGSKKYDLIGGCLYLKSTPNTAKTLAVYPSGRSNLVFADSVTVTEIGEIACAMCCNFTSITVPNTVRNIGPGAMALCDRLSKVVVPDGVTNISTGAFMQNFELMDVEIAGTVQTIGEMAFNHDYMPRDLEDERPGRLVLHEGIKTISSAAFSRTKYLTEVTIPDSVTTLGEGAFGDNFGLTKITVGSGVTVLPDSVFCFNEVLGSITFRGNITEIGARAFMSCIVLKTLELPDSVTTIGEEAFYNCYSLKSLDLPEGVTAIGPHALAYCSSLRKIIVPQSVQRLGSGAFLSCSGLQKAYLPKKFEDVADLKELFEECDLDEEDIIFYGSEGPGYVTATFVSQGETIATRRYLPEILDYMPTPSAKGLAFLGWYNDEEGGELASDSDLVSDTTFYARWTVSPFTDTGAWKPSEDSAFPGKVVWTSGNLEGGEVATASLKVTGPAAVRFSWKFTADDDVYNGDKFKLLLDGEVVADTTSPLWTSHSLDITEAGTHTVSWMFSRGYWSEDLELNCGWIANLRTVPGSVKKITFDPNGGTMTEATTRDVISVLGELPVAEKTGAMFAGWCTADGERVFATTEPSGDTTYTASWIALPFTSTEGSAWWVDEDGSWRAGKVAPGETSSVTMTVVGPFQLTFDWRCETDWDGDMQFFIDGELYDSTDSESWESVDWSCRDGERHSIEWRISRSEWADYSGATRGWLRNVCAGTPYTITWNNHDVTKSDTRSGKLGKLPLPRWQGYVTFDGWYTAAEGGEKVTSETPVTGDAQYYAHWISSPVATHWGDVWLFQPDGSLKSADWVNEYNPSVAEKDLRDGPGTLLFKWRMQSDSGRGSFSFLTDDPEGGPDLVYAKTLDETTGWIAERYETTNEFWTVRWGYNISGAYSGTECGWIKDITWCTNETMWIVRFDAVDGEVVGGDPIRFVVDGSAIGELPEIDGDFGTFLGWFTEPEGGEEITAETEITRDRTFFAHWEYPEPPEPIDPPEPEVQVWTVTFDAVGGEISGAATRSVTNECAVGALPDAAKADYKFLGWYTGAEDGEAISSKTVITSDVRFFAHWAFEGITIEPIDDCSTEIDGSFSLKINVTSGSTPTVTVTGLPAGIKYDAKTFTIGGKATKPDSSSTVTVSAKNATVKTPVTETFYLTVPKNFSTATFADAGLKADESYQLEAGVAPDLSGVFEALSDGEWKVVVSGLPAGLKYDAKAGELTGVATKEGVYTVTFTATRNKEQEVATATFEVVFKTLTVLPKAYCDDVVDGTVGTVTPLEGRYAAGSKVSLKATPVKGSVFAGWFDESDKPLAGAYRAASYAYVTTDADTTILAKFATEAEDAASLVVTVSDATTDADGSYTLDLNDCVSSITSPKLSVSGLPSGIKFDAKTLVISGKATMPGRYPVKVEATNTTVKKATTETTRQFWLTVPNDENIPVEDNYGPYIPGVAYDFEIAAAEGCSVSGLPAGFKFDAKTLRVSGAPTKPGKYAVTFTKTVNKVKRAAMATFTVSDLLLLTVNTEGSGKAAGAGSYAANAKVSLKATPDKGNVFVGWYDGDNCLSSLASYPYQMPLTDKTLTAKFISAAEEAATISATVGSFAFDSGAATVDTNITAGVYLEWAVAVNATTPVTVKVTGLPSGLKFDAKSNTIYGTPTAASKTDKSGAVIPSTVKITVTTASKTVVAYAIALTVDPLPDWAVGTFYGALRQVDRDEKGAVIVDDDGERHDWYDIIGTVTIASNGKVSGKMQLIEGDVCSFTFPCISSASAGGFDISGEFVGFDSKLNVAIRVDYRSLTDLPDQQIGEMAVVLQEFQRKDGKVWVDCSEMTVATDDDAPLMQNIWTKSGMTLPPNINGKTASVEVDDLVYKFKFGKDGNVATSLYDADNDKKAIATGSAMLSILDYKDQTWQCELCASLVIKKGDDGEAGIFDVEITDDGEVLPCTYRKTIPVE